MAHPRPTWIAQMPPRIFPRGPRAFYCYLCAFKSGTCFLFNYRLAAKFHVSTRTIRRWRSWLVNHKLIHTWYLDPKHPRINVHHYKTFQAWLTAMAIPKRHKLDSHPPLSKSDKEERVRAFRRALFAIPKRT